MFKLVFFVPKESCESVKKAVFSAGAGRQGNYKDCSWQVLGEGQFTPLAGSQPHIGQHNKVEKVEEYRVETLCSELELDAIVAALKESHPYEEPAYEVYRVEVF